MLTFSIIKADTGGWVGHSAVHPDMVEVAQRAIDEARGGLLVDGQVAGPGGLPRHQASSVDSMSAAA